MAKFDWTKKRAFAQISAPTFIVFSLNILLAKKKLVILQNWFGKIHEGWFLLLKSWNPTEISQNIVAFRIRLAQNHPLIFKSGQSGIKRIQKILWRIGEQIKFVTNFLWCLVRVFGHFNIKLTLYGQIYYHVWYVFHKVISRKFEQDSNICEDIIRIWFIEATFYWRKSFRLFHFKRKFLPLLIRYTA